MAAAVAVGQADDLVGRDDRVLHLDRRVGGRLG
jgi:hypothetical protein